MFDVSQLDAATPADAGATMNIIAPKTGTVARNENGEPITITLLGRFATKIMAVEKTQRLKRIELARRGHERTPDDAVEEQLEVLIAATVAWNFTSLDGKEFPCTKENARLLYSDQRFLHLRIQAEAFMNDTKNFTNG